MDDGHGYLTITVLSIAVSELKMVQSMNLNPIEIVIYGYMDDGHGYHSSP